MSEVEFFRIVLQQQDSTYFTGEDVVGTVNCRLKSRLKINAVRLDAKGTGLVHWIGTLSHGSKAIKYFRGHETYFQTSIVLTAKQNDQDLYLEPGNHTFPFRFTLPRKVPTSYECKDGRIRYCLTATIEIPWAFDKYTNKTMTVIKHVDLNQMPSLRQPYNTSESKTLCCFCCKSGPIVVKLSLKKTGFVSGEFLSANITIENQSKKEVNPPRVHLYEHVQLFAVRKTKDFTRKVCSFKVLQVTKPQTTEHFENVGVRIPPICPSSLSSCKVLERKYYLKLFFDTSGMTTTTEMSVPITIGTIPIREGSVATNDEDAPPAYPGDEPYLFQPSIFGRSLESALPPPYPDKGEILETDANDYIPRYPFLQQSKPVTQNESSL